MWSVIGGAIASLFAFYRERRRAEHELAMEEIEKGIRGGDPTLRRWSFIAAITPFALALYDPDLANSFFARISVLPDWYVELLMLIFISIWGLSVAKDILPSFAERIIRAFRNARE